MRTVVSIRGRANRRVVYPCIERERSGSIAFGAGKCKKLPAYWRRVLAQAEGGSSAFEERKRMVSRRE